jgi:RHS repeat-associated protein
LTGITDTVTAANSNVLSYSPANRLAAASGAWGNASYSYDGAGNIVTDVRPGESFAYTYNKRNRLVSVTRNGAAYATYTYNALEQLTSRTTSAAGGPTGTIHYIYDLDGHLIIEANGLASGVTTAIITLREYIWLPSNDNHMQVAGGTMGEALGLGSLAANDNNPVDLPLAIVDTVNTTPTLLMVHADHLGRPIRMTDATKATVWQASYKPWGEVQSISGTRTNNLRLPGQYFQIETNLAYNWHRHYDPTTGRYTQPDPLRFVDGPSVYAYAGSSPFMVTDRDGLDARGTYNWAIANMFSDGYGWQDPASNIGGLRGSLLGGRFALKCSKFAYDALNGGGNPPNFVNGRIPTVQDWKDGKVLGYSPIPIGGIPIPGDVVIEGTHMGIYAPFHGPNSPGTISAASYFHGNGVVQNDWGFRLGQSPTIFRCNCDNAR